MKPYVRDSLFCGGDTAGPTYSIDIKAGDWVLVFHANYSTQNRCTSTFNPAVAIGLTWTDGWRVGGTAAHGSFWITKATTDFTATFGPGITWQAGSAYGVTQAVLCLRGVKYLAEYYTDARDSTARGPLTVGQSGRPYNWASATSNILTSNFTIDGVDTGVLSIGSWLWSSSSAYGMGSWVPDTGDTLAIWDDVASWRHTCVAVGWHDPDECKAYLAANAASTALSFSGNNTGNETGTPSMGVGVSIAIVPEEYTPDPGPTPGLPTLCMGDGTVVTLEGWWDGSQLLPAEFVGV